MSNVKIANVLNNLPLIFERNIGQYDNKVQFVLNKKECTTFFTDKEIVLAFRSNEKIQELKELDSSNLYNTSLRKMEEYQINVLRVCFKSSNKIPQIIGKNEFNCTLNYFKGEDISNWKCSIPLYEKLLYKEIYNGIDILYYEREGVIKWDFIVEPNKNINNILLNLNGANNIELDDNGDINVNIKERILKISKPEAYQNNNDEKIESSFGIDEDGNIKFNISNYNEEDSLTITISVSFDNFNSTCVVDRANSIAVDEKNCVYITGEVGFQNFPDKKIYKNVLSGKDYGAFLVKIDTTKKGQSALKYAAYIGGEGIDEAVGIAVDNEKNAYIVGATNSIYEFPVTEKSYAYSYPGGSKTGFLIKIDTKKVGLSSLVYGTYLGGNSYDYAYSVAIDKEKNVYVVGLTNSNFGFPISESAYEKNNDDAVDVGFLLKLDINKERKDALLYGTYFGGNDSTSFSALAVDDNGYVYVTGVTQSKDFPVTQNAYETKFKGGLSSAFISKFNLNKTGKESLIYSSFLCGDGEEAGYGIAVDSRECAYITGVTNSLNNFPITQNAFQNSISNIEGSGFLIKVNTQLSGEKGLAYGSYIDGNGSDVCSDIKIDYNNYVYICGFTTSTDFPVNSYENGWVKNGYNSFLLKLDLNKERRKALLLGTFLRENINDFALGLALDNELNTYITGYAHSISEDRSKEKEGYYEESSISIMKVSTRICNLSIEKSQYNIDVEPGGKTQYEINIINNGPDVATDIRITDVLGRGITVKEISVSKGSIHQLGKEIIWKVSELNIGESAKATIKIRVLINSEISEKETFINVNDNIYCSKSSI